MGPNIGWCSAASRRICYLPGSWIYCVETSSAEGIGDAPKWPGRLKDIVGLYEAPEGTGAFLPLLERMAGELIGRRTTQESAEAEDQPGLLGYGGQRFFARILARERCRSSKARRRQRLCHRPDADIHQRSS